MGSKRKSGRPPELPSGTRKRALVIRLSEEEYEAMKRTAGDYPFGTWARVVLRAEVRRMQKGKT